MSKTSAGSKGAGSKGKIAYFDDSNERGDD